MTRETDSGNDRTFPDFGFTLSCHRARRRNVSQYANKLVRVSSSNSITLTLGFLDNTFAFSRELGFHRSCPCRYSVRSSLTCSQSSFLFWRRRRGVVTWLRHLTAAGDQCRSRYWKGWLRSPGALCGERAQLKSLASPKSLKSLAQSSATTENSQLPFPLIKLRNQNPFH